MMLKSNRLIKKKQNRPGLIHFISVLMAMVLLCGCGAGSTQGSETNANEEITLIEPVGISANYDIATMRDLYKYDIYNSVVAPYVTEYAFEKDRNFKKYGAAPGAEVKKGDAIVYSETREIDKQIEEKKEVIEDLENAHVVSVDELQKDIYDAKQAEFKVHEGYAAMYSFEPDPAWKDAHRWWETIAVGPEISYKRMLQARLRLEQALKETNEMYELEHKYQEDGLKRMQDKIQDATITAKEDGVVVNCGELNGGDFVPKDVSMIAVGDPTVKVMKTEYISKNTMAKAEEVYAVVGGKRYEVMYEPIEQEEYNRLTLDNETVYSTFYLKDADDLEMGAYGVIVLVKESRTNVLCVPNDAVKMEKDSCYVYLYDGENSVYTPVQIGMKDGVYSEVLSGVKEGDMVLSGEGVTLERKQETLQYGETYTAFEGSGYFFYPFSEWIINPVDEGKTYIKEKLITKYQRVKAGDVLMTLEVVSDSIEIERCNKRLGRLAERLAKLQKEKYDNDARRIIDRSVEKAINANIAETTQVQRRLSKLTKYSGIVEVTAPTDGIITDEGELKEGDLIYPGTKLIMFADDSMRYIVLKDSNNALSFGNEAEIEYVDQNSARQKMTGKIATVGNSSLTKDLVKDWALVELPEESKAMIDGSAEGEEGKWSRSMYTVKVKTRLMDHVILVPKQAVYVMGGSTYVSVVNDDGTVTRKGFIAGGSNNNYYWAVSGLDEGMNICWE